MVKIDGLGQKIGIASTIIGAAGILSLMAKSIVSMVKNRNEDLIPGERLAEKPKNATYYVEMSEGQYFYLTTEDPHHSKNPFMP